MHVRVSDAPKPTPPKTQQQRDQLQSEITQLRMQLSVHAHELKERAAALKAATDQATQWAAERQALTAELAGSRGRLEGIETSVRGLEARAVAAETRLAEANAARTPTGRGRRG